jgi:protein gp37
MTKIQWTDLTINPIVGCSKISAGCLNCYAATASNTGRLQQFTQYQGIVDRGGNWTGRVNFVPEQLTKLFAIRKPTRVFLPSMSDLFHPHVSDDWRDLIFGAIALSPLATVQVLTKRADTMREYFRTAKQRIRIAAVDLGRKYNIDHEAMETHDWNYPLPNLWLGVSVENQACANERIPLLLATTTARRFISCEPLLEPIELTDYRWVDRRLNYLVNSFSYDSAPTIDSGNSIVRGYRSIDWVIVGGESGQGARPFHQEWSESLVSQCQAHSVPIFVKQMGSNFYKNGVRVKLQSRSGSDPLEWAENLRIRECLSIDP